MIAEWNEDFYQGVGRKANEVGESILSSVEFLHMGISTTDAELTVHQTPI